MNKKKQYWQLFFSLFFLLVVWYFYFLMGFFLLVSSMNRKWYLEKWNDTNTEQYRYQFNGCQSIDLFLLAYHYHHHYNNLELWTEKSECQWEIIMIIMSFTLEIWNMMILCLDGNVIWCKKRSIFSIIFLHWWL